MAMESPRYFGPQARTISVPVQAQVAGDCFAHAASRCLVRALQQCYYPKYDDKEKSSKLYTQIHDYIVEHKGAAGGQEIQALRLCLGLDGDSNGLSGGFVAGDLYSIRNHLQVTTLDNLQQVKDALDRLSRPCFAFNFRNSSQWDDFQAHFRDAATARTPFSRGHVRESFLPDKHSGHAVNIRRYDERSRSFDCVNSWGSTWGVHGRFSIAEDDLLCGRGRDGGGAFEYSVATDVAFKDSLPAELKKNVNDYRRRHARFRRSELREIFRVMDKNGDGCVSKIEFAAAAGGGKSGNDVPLSQRELQHRLLDFPLVRSNAGSLSVFRIFTEIKDKDKDFFTYEDLEGYFERMFTSEEYEAGGEVDPLELRLLRLFDACRGGVEQGLDAVLAEAGAGAGAAGGEAGAAAVTALVNSQDREGYTCLCVAVLMRHVRIVERLCRVPGLDANLGRIFGGLGYSALMCAASRGHTDIVQALLIVPGIDINARNIDGGGGGGGIYLVRRLAYGHSALILAAIGGHTEIVQALLAVPGLDVNARNDNGLSALIEAANNGYTETVQALLAVPGIDVNAHYSTMLNGIPYKRTALHAVAELGLEQMTQLLLSVGRARVDVLDSMHKTPLHLALSRGRENLALILLSEGRVNVKRQPFNRILLASLHIAAQGLSLNLVRSLIEDYGADVFAKNKSGQSPLDVARARNPVSADVVEYLQIKVAEANVKYWAEFSQLFGSANLFGLIGAFAVLLLRLVFEGITATSPSLDDCCKGAGTIYGILFSFYFLRVFFEDFKDNWGFFDDEGVIEYGKNDILCSVKWFRSGCFLLQVSLLTLLKNPDSRNEKLKSVLISSDKTLGPLWQFLEESFLVFGFALFLSIVAVPVRFVSAKTNIKLRLVCGEAVAANGIGLIGAFAALVLCSVFPSDHTLTIPGMVHGSVCLVTNLRASNDEVSKEETLLGRLWKGKWRLKWVRCFTSLIIIYLEEALAKQMLQLFGHVPLGERKFFEWSEKSMLNFVCFSALVFLGYWCVVYAVQGVYRFLVWVHGLKFVIGAVWCFYPCVAVFFFPAFHSLVVKAAGTILSWFFLALIVYSVLLCYLRAVSKPVEDIMDVSWYLKPVSLLFAALNYAFMALLSPMVHLFAVYGSVWTFLPRLIQPGTLPEAGQLALADSKGAEDPASAYLALHLVIGAVLFWHIMHPDQPKKEARVEARSR